MATDQVLNWIGGATVIDGQQPLKLSKSIENFESDFSNGYLFGEILTQYGICESIVTFSKKTNKEAKVHNFYQIEDSLRYLKVPFDAKLSHQIMNEERGASLRLLYQLKLALDKHFAKGDLTVTNLKKTKVASLQSKTKELETKLPEIHKQHGVDGPTFKFKHKPLIETEKKLLKFEVARANLEKKAADDEAAETNMLKSLQQSKRQDALQKMKENQTFMKEWQAEGKQNWKKNRDIRFKEIARMMSFEDREVQIYKQGLNKQLVQHTNEMNQGIEDFHENMRKLGIEENISIQEAVQRQEEKKGIPPGQIQNFSYAATMNKIKETKNNNEFAGKERERRNRKMQVDQRRIQETLDAKKYEENLIIRLMNRQAQEKDQAYSRWREAKCQNIVKNNMISQSMKNKEERDKKTHQIQEELKRQAEEAEADRKKLKAKNKIEYDQIRKNQKLAKRALNIEIASELVDLIMDVADEAYDFQESNANKAGDEKLMTKATWRDWMDIFTKGKKVSEQNLIINEDDNQAQVQAKDSMAVLLGGSTSAAVQPFKILDEVKNEPIYDELLQYICMTGNLNLKLVAPDKWDKFKDIIQKDNNLSSRNFDLQFLDELSVPQNVQLGQYIDKLYNPTKDEMSLMNPISQRNTERSSAMKMINQDERKFVPDFPTYHPIKLCIVGKAFSGKKTQAQMIIDKFGADKLTLFNMNDIVREALNYVDPSQKQEEVADPKKGGKGKPADTPQDIFAGKDTTAYKEIATILLNQVQLVTGDKESIPGKETDLLQLISDDNLLAQLFVQKLKLTFPSEGPSKEEQENELRDLVEKEKELLIQLEESKANDGAEADPKAKGGKGAKATKSPEEIQEEITKLIAASTNGWILLDFPRNINQAKQLEEKFQGYELHTDMQKNQKLQNFEAWTKFTDAPTMTKPGFTGELTSQPSLFDKVFILQTSKEECFRRCSKRFQDPTTSTIYHEEDTPAPDDPKIKEKLVPYYGQYTSEEDMIQKVDSNHIQASENEPALTSFVRIFGNLDQEANVGMSTLEEIITHEKKDQQEIFDVISNSIQEVFKFKQIARDREFAQLKQKIQKEEQEKLAAEQKSAEEAAEEETKANQNNENQEDKTEDKQEAEDKVPKIEVEQALKTIGSKASLYSKKSHQVPLSQSKMSSGGMASKKQKRVEYTNEYKISLWEEMETLYIRDSMITLTDLKKQKESITDSLNSCQRQFIQFLERPDQKQEKINEFVLSFNKFSQEFPDLRKDDQTKDELMNRLEALSNTMWNIIETRKNESIEQISKMSQGGWSDVEMRNLCRNMASMIEIEIKKFEAVYKIQMMQDPPVELDAEILTKKLLDRGGKTYDDQNNVSPVLEQVITNLLTKLDDLVVKNPIVKQVINDMQGKILVQEMNIFMYRLALIYSWALVILQEIFINSRHVYGQLDDWIVDAVAQENQLSQQVLSVLKEAIQSEQIRIEEYQTILQNLSLFQRIQTLHFSGNEVPLYLQNIQIPLDDVDSSRFTVDQLRQLYVQMRYYTSVKGSSSIIDQQTFINIMLVSFRQMKVPLCWKYINFDKISGMCQKFAALPLVGSNPADQDSPKMYQIKQGLGQQSYPANMRQWVNWQQILTYFSLLTSYVPNEKEIAQLKVKLTEAGSNQHVTKIQFKTTPFWFDQIEGKPDAELEAQWLAQKKLSQNDEDDYDSEDEDEETIQGSQKSRGQLDSDRIMGIKDLLFDIHRVQTGEDKLNVADFIDFLIKVSSNNQDSETFTHCLFGKE